MKKILNDIRLQIFLILTRNSAFPKSILRDLATTLPGKITVLTSNCLRENAVCYRWEGHPLQVRHKQDWGQGFIFLLSRAAVLPGSVAGSDVVERLRVSS